MDAVFAVVILTVIRLGVPFALMMLVGTLVQNRQASRPV